VTVTIPAFMLTEEIAIEAYSGETGAGGPAYADAVTVAAHVEPRRRLIVLTDKRSARSEMFAIIAPGATVTPESRITYSGRTYRVLDVFPVPAPGGGTHHIEIALA
jgi:hypothetical protein